MIYIVAPLSLCAASALVGWLTGYDFNQRNGKVATWVGVTLLLAAVFSGMHP